MPARAIAATTAGPRGRRLGAPNTSSTSEPPTMPAPTASTMSSGPSCAAAARKSTAITTIAQPRRRHGRLIHGEPSTTVETMPAMKFESITPMEATSRSQVGALHRGQQFGPAEALHDQVVQERGDRLRDDRGEDQHAEQAEPPLPEDEQTHGGRDQRGEPLEEVVERPRDGLRQEVERADGVALEPDQGVGRAGRDRHAEQHEQHADDEVQHVRTACARGARPPARRSPSRSARGRGGRGPAPRPVPVARRCRSRPR